MGAAWPSLWHPRSRAPMPPPQPSPARGGGNVVLIAHGTEKIPPPRGGGPRSRAAPFPLPTLAGKNRTVGANARLFRLGKKGKQGHLARGITVPVLDAPPQPSRTRRSWRLAWTVAALRFGTRVGTLLDAGEARAAPGRGGPGPARQVVACETVHQGTGADVPLGEEIDALRGGERSPRPHRAAGADRRGERSAGPVAQARRTGPARHDRLASSAAATWASPTWWRWEEISRASVGG